MKQLFASYCMLCMIRRLALGVSVKRDKAAHHASSHKCPIRHKSLSRYLAFDDHTLSSHKCPIRHKSLARYLASDDHILLWANVILSYSLSRKIPLLYYLMSHLTLAMYAMDTWMHYIYLYSFLNVCCSYSFFVCLFVCLLRISGKFNILGDEVMDIFLLMLSNKIFLSTLQMICHYVK